MRRLRRGAANAERPRAHALYLRTTIAFRFLRLRVRVSRPLSRMDAGRSQRVRRGLGQTLPTQGRQGVLSLPRAWTSPVFYTTGPRRARQATQNKAKQN